MLLYKLSLLVFSFLSLDMDELSLKLITYGYSKYQIMTPPADRTAGAYDFVITSIEEDCWEKNTKSDIRQVPVLPMFWGYIF